MFHAKVVGKIKTNISRSLTVFRKRVVHVIAWKRTVEEAGHR
jgi:hypothetical protein